jgi:hypothetical protein
MSIERSGESQAGKAVERRKRSIPVAIDRRNQEPGERKKHLVERRRQVDPTTCEREYTDEEIAFMRAMDQYKRDNRRPFPTWSEVLEVLLSLGYRKVESAGPMPGNAPKADADRRTKQAPVAAERRKG